MAKHRLTTYERMHAPTKVRMDATYVLTMDALELARQIAAKRSDLLTRLSEE